MCIEVVQYVRQFTAQLRGVGCLRLASHKFGGVCREQTVSDVIVLGGVDAGTEQLSGLALPATCPRS